LRLVAVKTSRVVEQREATVMAKRRLRKRVAGGEPKPRGCADGDGTNEPMNPDDPYCFLICSFADDPELLAARAQGINPATRCFGFPTYRVDEIPAPDNVIEATRRHIADADFVIADLTGQKPNCYYEVGYAHALGRPVIHIMRSTEEPQFNVAGLQFVKYRDPQHLREQLTRQILTHVLTTHGSSNDPEDNKGSFGRRAFQDPFVVTGRVKEDPENTDGTLSFLIDLRVRSVDPKRPVSGPVTFCLHGSFQKRRHTINVNDGEAILTDIESLGTFTVGVTLHKPNIQLEIDLSKLPGAGSEFRKR
jgi:hypothetical protein